MTIRAWASFTMLAALAGAGCATMKAQDSMARLNEAVEAYNHAFRWKNYERSAGFLPAEVRAAYVAAYEDDESSLQIEDYRVLSVDVEDPKAATVKVKLKYMLMPSVTVQNGTLVQHWHEVAGEWILETEDNSLRTLDPAKLPKDKRAYAKPAVDPAKEGDTEVEKVGPESKVKNENDAAFESDPP